MEMTMTQDNRRLAAEADARADQLAANAAARYRALLYAGDVKASVGLLVEWYGLHAVAAALEPLEEEDWARPPTRP